MDHCLDEAEQLVIEAILAGPTWSQPVDVLRRTAGLCRLGGFDPPQVKIAGEEVLAGLVEARWCVRWKPGQEQYIDGVKVRAVTLPEVITLTPLGAERLGYTLAQPVQDGPRSEPHWVPADPEFFDATGRHPKEPKHFHIQGDWCGVRRALTLIERIDVARAHQQRLRVASGRVQCQKKPLAARPVAKGSPGQAENRSTRRKKKVETTVAGGLDPKVIIQGAAVNRYRSGDVTADQVGSAFGVTGKTILRWVGEGT